MFSGRLEGVEGEVDASKTTGVVAFVGAASSAPNGLDWLNEKAEFGLGGSPNFITGQICCSAP